MKTIGVIGAMDKEIELIRQQMQNPETLRDGPFEFYLGAMEGKNIVLLKGGIGKVNAAVGCALLIERHKPGLVINTGSAGGVGEGLTFGDAVISTGLVYHDVNVTAFKYKLGQVPGMPAVFPVPENLVALAENAIEELKSEGLLPADFRHVRGLIASGDVFMHESAHIASVAAEFPDVRALEMESAAVAQACFLFSVPCLALRALSDVAGEESPMTHDEFLPIASRNSCEIVRRIIRLYREN